MNGLMISHPWRAAALRGARGLLVAGGVVLALSACAPMPAGPAEYAAGRTRVVLPTVAWEDLGVSDTVLPFYPQPGAFPLQTRAVALRGVQRELLAVLLVQSNSNNRREATLWTGNCPDQRDLLVEDATAASPVRIDCLRFKRWANNADWLQKNHPELARWVVEHKAEVPAPYSHLNYRFATQGGAYIEVNALVDQRLLRPKTNNNEAFLHAGRPAQEWVRKVADEAKLSTARVDGAFFVPDFPLPLPSPAIP
jgi:hypothetical protein